MSSPPPSDLRLHHEHIINAVQKYYSFLTQLPYVPPDDLVFPPAEGWSDVDERELRNRGKTREVIELLQRLPYLRPPAPYKKWMISPDTVEIAYCDGELYPAYVDDIQPVPAHCIWLTRCESRDGAGLLVDTLAGTVTEWTPLGRSVVVDYDVYESLPVADRWMAHATINVTRFFERYKRAFLKMVWMVVHDSNGAQGTAQWYITAETRQDEIDVLSSDEEYEQEEGLSIESDSGSSEGDNAEDVESSLSEDELDDLMRDAFEEDAALTAEAFRNAANEEADEDSADILTITAPVDHTTKHLLELGDWSQRTREFYKIYRSSGWPSEFDREGCASKLHDFAQREKCKSLANIAIESDEPGIVPDTG